MFMDLDWGGCAENECSPKYRLVREKPDLLLYPPLGGNETMCTCSLGSFCLSLSNKAEIHISYYDWYNNAVNIEKGVFTS